MAGWLKSIIDVSIKIVIEGAISQAIAIAMSTGAGKWLMMAMGAKAGGTETCSSQSSDASACCQG